jgi:hypothetical protein
VQEEAQERRQASYRRALNKASDMSLSLRPAAADGAEEGTGGWGGVRVKEEPMETDGPAAGRVAVKKEPAEVGRVTRIAWPARMGWGGEGRGRRDVTWRVLTRLSMSRGGPDE